MRAHRTFLSALMIVPLIVPSFAACGANRESQFVALSATASHSASEPTKPSAVASALSAAGKAGEATAMERLIIRTAELRLRVVDVDAVEASLKGKVGELGGYVLSAQKSGSGDAATLQVSFRVPAERFEEALTAVQAMAKWLDSKSVTGQDVTEEYVDLDAQVRNLETTRARLLTFMEKAFKVEDALSVQRALTDIQGQIERIAGRIKYLRQNAALSTINVYVYPERKTPLVSTEGWRPGETGRVAIRGLVEFAQLLGNTTIVLGVWSPVWVPVVALVWWVRKRRKTKGK
jgi:hypothetical protein